MKTAQPITPEAAGLSISVIAGPRGALQGDWPNIEYIVELLDSRRRPVWRGEYRLGVGHVKPAKDRTAGRCLSQYTADEESLLMTWQSKPHAQFINKQRWADVAAKLAKSQKVTPTLNDVCHSLLSDGTAFFDGQCFEDWAADFGYSDDSIKAKETFEACDKIGRELSRALSRDELDGLREWASNY